MNMSNDIENNINEIIIPEFTLDIIEGIENHYYEELTIAQKIYETNSDSDSEDIEDLYTSFHFNELINEHISNVKKMYIKLDIYNSIENLSSASLTSMEKITEYKNNKLHKCEFYLDEIEPLIKSDLENLYEILSIIKSK